jgi:hypothetical protein
MAHTSTLGITISDGATLDALMEKYAEVIDMVQKGAISQQIKNINLSGDPEAGSVVVRRMATSIARTLGTARTGGAGDKLSNNGVTVNLNVDKEIVEEIARKDIDMYGIPDILAKRVVNHELAMIRDLDTAFFTEAEAEGTEVDVSGESTIEAKLEALIQAVETVENDNVDGVDREMLVVTLKPSVYGDLRNYLDTVTNPNGQSYEVFHDVRVFSNVRQTEDAICMAMGSIAQPVHATPYAESDIPLSNDKAVMLFYSYGTQAVMSDLIAYADFSDEVSA